MPIKTGVELICNTIASQNAENDPNIKAIFLKGNEKAFCSGGDAKCKFLQEVFGYTFLIKINNIIHANSIDESHHPEHFTLNKENRTIIDRCFKFKTAEEIMNALENDGTKFAFDAAKAILKRSPTCTKINVENFNRVPNMSFIDLVKTEYMSWNTIVVIQGKQSSR